MDQVFFAFYSLIDIFSLSLKCVFSLIYNIMCLLYSQWKLYQSRKSPVCLVLCPHSTRLDLISLKHRLGDYIVISIIYFILYLVIFKNLSVMQILLFSFFMALACLTKDEVALHFLSLKIHALSTHGVFWATLTKRSPGHGHLPLKLW